MLYALIPFAVVVYLVIGGVIAALGDDRDLVGVIAVFWPVATLIIAIIKLVSFVYDRVRDRLEVLRDARERQLREEVQELRRVRADLEAKIVALRERPPVTRVA